MSEFSRGPWRLNKEASHPWVVEAESNIPGIYVELFQVGYKPNACLAAVAPRMFEALEAIIASYNTYMAADNPNPATFLHDMADFAQTVIDEYEDSIISE